MNGGFNPENFLKKVYQLAYQLAMKIFEISKRFPQEEKYSLLYMKKQVKC
ncbi:MAG: four helix bundle protein, partial [Bacteroidales bacterium]|nr:four helix bundle protein [Bacteroidales bacterium]